MSTATMGHWLETLVLLLVSWNGLFFSGTSTYVSVPASSTLDVGSYGTGLTVEGWIAPGPITMEYTAPIIEWDSGTAIGVQFWASDSLWASVVDTAGNDHIMSSAGGLITEGVLQHVALTYDQSTGTAVLYCNGVAVATPKSWQLCATDDLSPEHRTTHRGCDRRRV